MRGGYLTLDFSDVKIENPSNLTSSYLGKRKGLYKYLQTNTKPIYVILSDSMVNAVNAYFGNELKLTTNVVRCINDVCDKYIGTTNSKNRLFILFVFQGEPAVLEPTHFYLDVNEDDTIYFSES